MKIWIARKLFILAAYLAGADCAPIVAVKTMNREQEILLASHVMEIVNQVSAEKFGQQYKRVEH